MAGIVVNGEPRDLDGVPLHTNALDFLRACGLTGAKEGCAEGECGACSVMVARPAPDGSEATQWTAMNSCLVPAASLDGQEVVTSEGLGSPDALHPVQHEMAVRGGSQCGYCTPGFVCSMAAEFYRDVATAAAGSTCTRSAATCAAAPATARSRTPPTRSARPTDGDPLAVRRSRARPVGPADAARRRRGDVRAPRRPGRGARRPGRAPGRRRGRREHRLGRRGQHPREPGPARGRGRPAARAARLLGDRRRGAHRCRADADRGRAPPRGGRRAAAAARRPDAAVRLAADPQRRDAGRQPRHGLADRRRPAGAARPGVVGGAHQPRRRPHRAAGRLLHRLPPVGAAARRADPRGRGAAAGVRPHRVPQDREAALRRHLVGGRGVRARRRRRGRREGQDRARRSRRHARSGRSPPRPRSRAGPGTRTPSTPPPR